MSLKPLQHENIYEKVSRELLKYIENELQEGARLPSERELANRLNVGRNSVREALQRLQMLGAVEIRRGAGVFVKKIDVAVLLRHISSVCLYNQQEVEYLLEARRVFEVMLLDLIIERITPETIGELEHLIEKMESRRAQGKSFVQEDFEFHVLIIKSLKNPFLVQWSEFLKQYFDRAYKEKKMSYDAPTIEEHRMLLEAIKERNVTRAKSVMEKHLTRLKKRFEEGR